MRWKITTLDPEIIEDVKSNSKIEKIKTNRTLVITVGDIVGKGKSAAGAVKNLAETLPQFIEKLKNMPNQAEEAIKNKAYGIKDQPIAYGKSILKSVVNAETVNSFIQPLSVIVDGMEKFRSVMDIVDIVTPIAKTIARATGVWCSPGNVADLGQIAWGLGQQILIYVATSALLYLKEKIWNYEFELYTIPSTTSRKISILLKDYEKKSTLPSTRGIIINHTDSPAIAAVDTAVTSHFTGGGSSGSGGFPPPFNPDLIPNENENDNGIDPYDGIPRLEIALAKANGWKTQKKIEGQEYTRILYGSLMDNGIIYSDDNGETWARSSQKKDSFSKFSKIMVNGKWMYVAGSTYYVKEIVPTTDKEISRDEKNHYNKDYYNFDKNGNIYKLTKKEKDAITEKAFNILHDKKVFEEPIGIIYSDDDGITWKPTSITKGSFENFFEAPEKEGYPARLIAASYDYKGVYYSDDGVNWNHSDFKYTETEIVEVVDEKGNVTNSEEKKTIINDTTGRWTYFVGMDGRKLAITNIEKDYPSKINNPSINTIVNINKDPTGTKQINLNVDLNISNYNLIDSGNLIIDMKLTNGIIKYIHDNYPDRIPYYDQDFWHDKIIAINEGRYTMDDAREGNDLETNYPKE